MIDVKVEVSPFALAARATALAIIGDHAAALADVVAVEAMDSVSYWDRAIAQVAGAVAASGDEAVRRRGELQSLIDCVDDVVLASYAAHVVHGLQTDADAGGLPDLQIGGWRDVARLLVPEHRS